MKALIAGAGVAGLSIGWRLAQAGISVEILERGLAGYGASWASAGMIAPGAELGRETTAMARFAGEAKAKWPAFAEELEKASGEPVFFRQTGSLLVAQDEVHASALKAQAAELAAEGTFATWLTREDLLAREPLLASTLFGALHNPSDAQVDNRALLRALAAALVRAGGRLREQCELRALLLDKERARGFVTTEGTLEADIFILACGAWMNLLGGLSPHHLPPVKPVKGQMAAVEPPLSTQLPHSLIWADDVYLVPRHNRLFIGATVEDAGFDLSVSREARDRLLAAATRLIPAIARWPLKEMWAGLRPKAPDDAPVLGPTAIRGLYVASGQFRNGILFAPSVADLLPRLILNQSTNEAYRAFDPRRFANC